MTLRLGEDAEEGCLRGELVQEFLPPATWHFPLLEAGQTAPCQPVSRETSKERTPRPSDGRACLQGTL